ncbi:MAG: hypothetical protein M3Y12_16160 [Bacteroidota bacterium]|nr:hypothetical protein [Bacteroidota bacterium]
MIFGKGIFVRGGYWPAVLLLCLLVSCQPPLENVVLQNTFEQAGALDVSRDYAHTGGQSLKIGQPSEYSNLSDCTWAALGQPHHLRLRLWTWLPNAQLSFARLVLNVRRPSSTPGAPPNVLHSQVLNMCEVIKRYRQWEPTSFYVSLPKELQPSDQVLLFMWVPPSQGGAVYVDDFSIEKLN